MTATMRRQGLGSSGGPNTFLLYRCFLDLYVCVHDTLEGV
jgi:hypothetical protein